MTITLHGGFLYNELKAVANENSDTRVIEECRRMEREEDANNSFINITKNNVLCAMVLKTPRNHRRRGPSLGWLASGR